MAIKSWTAWDYADPAHIYKFKSLNVHLQMSYLANEDFSVESFQFVEIFCSFSNVSALTPFHSWSAIPLFFLGNAASFSSCSASLTESVFLFVTLRVLLYSAINAVAPVHESLEYYCLMHDVLSCIQKFWGLIAKQYLIFFLLWWECTINKTVSYTLRCRRRYFYKNLGKAWKDWRNGWTKV